MRVSGKFKVSAITIAVGSALASQQVQAATINVTTTADGAPGTIAGQCTLRDAVYSASTETVPGDSSCVQGDAGYNQITFGVTGTITLDAGLGYLTVLYNDLTISGPGADQLTISGNGLTGLILASGASLAVSDLTLTEGGLVPAGEGGDPDPIAGGYYGSGIAAYACETLQISDVVISDSYSINGGGVAAFACDEVIIERSEITDNSAYVGGGGVSIVFASQVTISETLISGNQAPTAGGLYAGAVDQFFMEDSRISGNSAMLYAGGAFIAGPFSPDGPGPLHMEIINSTIEDNDAGGYFGGLQAGGAPMTGQMSGSTISNNSAGYGVGGFLLYTNAEPFPEGNGLFDIVNTTISGNSGEFVGGAGISGPARVRHVTITDNVASDYIGGLYVTEDALIENSIIADNQAGDEVNDLFVFDRDPEPAAGILAMGLNGWRAFHSGAASPHNTLPAGGLPPSGEALISYSLVGDTDGFDEAPGSIGNIFGVSAGLGPLADNGGPTLTHALLAGSAAIDAGDPGFAPPPAFDQRGAGFDRVVGGRIDIGSFELQGLTPFEPTPVPLLSPVGLAIGGGALFLLGLAGLRRRRTRH